TESDYRTVAIKAFLNHNDKLTLPTPPSVATLILEELGREDIDFDRLSHIITADSALTARILKVANSPLFSPAGNIDCIHVALTRLGTIQVTSIALSFILVHTFNKRRVDSAFDFNFFWRHALTSAVAANLLHKELYNHNGNTFITGLLHDVGILIAGSQVPEYCDLFDNSAAPLEELREKEQQTFGFSHCQLGAEVLKEWQIPESITQPILYHHNPEEAPPEYRDAAFVIQVADLIANMFHGRPSTDKFGVLEKLLKKKKIDQATIDRLVQEIFTNSLKTLAFFEIPPDKIKSPGQLLQEANAILGKLNLNTDVELREMKRERDTLVENSKQLYRANSELSRLAFEDNLTGLHNMRYFYDFFQREIQRSLRYKTCFSLILLDLDNFKEVNDTYGHPAGDRVLQYIAELIPGSLRQVDLAARYGGEEFAVFLPETNRDDAMIIAERLRHQIEALKTPWQKHKIKVTASIGVAFFCPENKVANQDEIIARADRAMYMAKEEGKNRVHLADPDTPAR
ncbi:MAG: GGDEF domain-containing protein, partial [Geobacteraceae bacterium]|nr:GGDEF domain-containing protein [Geobacteraceae bacterium]